MVEVAWMVTGQLLIATALRFPVKESREIRYFLRLGGDPFPWTACHGSNLVDRLPSFPDGDFAGVSCWEGDSATAIPSARRGEPEPL